MAIRELRRYDQWGIRGTVAEITKELQTATKNLPDDCIILITSSMDDGVVIWEAIPAGETSQLKEE